MSRKTTKKTSTNTQKTKTKAPVDPPKDDVEVRAETVNVNTAAGPSEASLARRKRALIDELRDERTSVQRSAEIHTIINTELADVPILSAQEISRLAA